MQNPKGEKVAAPVVVVNHMGPAAGVLGSRWVFLDFDPAPGYWDSSDGLRSSEPAQSMPGKGQHPSRLKCPTQPSGKARVPKLSFTYGTLGWNSSTNRKPDRSLWNCWALRYWRQNRLLVPALA